MYIEPCCYEKQLTELLAAIEGKGNVAHFFSNSDWDLNALLPFFVYKIPGCDVTLCLVNVEQNVLDTVRKLLVRVVTNPETKQPMNLVNHFTLITQGNNRKEILDYLKGVSEDRLSVCEDNIGFRCLTCANDQHQYVVNGSLNQRILSSTQLFTMTTGKKLYNEVQEVLASKQRVKRIKDWKSAYERIVKQNQPK